MSGVVAISSSIQARAKMQGFKFNSHNDIELRGPVRRSDDTTITTGTCIANLFHDRKDTNLTADALSAATVLAVAATMQFEVGDHVLVMLDTNAWHVAGPITAIDDDAQTLTITTGLASAAASGRRVCGVLSDGGALDYQIIMTAYNAPNAVSGTYDWGWRGTIVPTQAGAEVGIPVRVEIELTDGVSSEQVVDVFRVQIEGGS